MPRVLLASVVTCAFLVGFASQPQIANAHHHGWGGGRSYWGGPSFNIGFGFPRYSSNYRTFGYSYGCSPYYFGGYYPACSPIYSSCYSPFYSSWGYAYPQTTAVLSYRPVIVLPSRPVVVVPAPAPRDVVPARPAALEAKVRESTLEARRRAERYVELGDKLFAKQKYQEALQQYKSATSAAPDRAATYFRQGFALLATNRHEMAATSFRRGLAVEPGYVADDFRLSRVYGDNRMAKAAHLESLAGVALDRPTRSDLLFAIGIFLHYDGQLDRAQKFFQRTAELTGPEDRYVALFLTDSPEIPIAERAASDGSEI